MIYKTTIQRDPIIGLLKTIHFPADNWDDAVEKAEQLRKRVEVDVSAPPDRVRTVQLVEIDITIVEPW